MDVSTNLPIQDVSGELPHNDLLVGLVAHRKRSALSCKRCVAGACAIVTLVIVSAICYGIFLLGQTVLISLTDPHRDVHVRTGVELNETKIVRPYYGRVARGSLDHFDLGVMLWTSHPSADVDEDGAADLHGEGTAQKDDGGIRWRPILQDIVAKNVPYDGKPVKFVQRVVLDAATA
jgi:hypothetical protein